MNPISIEKTRFETVGTYSRRVMNFLFMLFLLLGPTSIFATSTVLQPDAKSDGELAAIVDTTKLALRLENITDEGLSQIRRFTGLRTLGLISNQITGPGLSHLIALKNLESLSLVVPNLDESRIVVLNGCTSLRTLAIDSAKITDRSLSQLGDLSQLRHLSIRGASIKGVLLSGAKIFDRLTELELDDNPLTDDVFKRLARSKDLVQLSLARTTVTGEGLGALKSLTSLQVLKLSGSRFSDAGTPFLVAIPDLRSLDISDTKISDRSVKDLSQLRKIAKLSIRKTAITRNGLRELRAALPLAAIVPPAMVAESTREDQWWNIVWSCLRDVQDPEFSKRVSDGGAAIAKAQYRQAIREFAAALDRSKSVQGRCWFQDAAMKSLLANAYNRAGERMKARDLYEEVQKALTRGMGDQFPAAHLVQDIIAQIDKEVPRSTSR